MRYELHVYLIVFPSSSLFEGTTTLPALHEILHLSALSIPVPPKARHGMASQRRATRATAAIIQDQICRRGALLTALIAVRMRNGNFMLW